MQFIRSQNARHENTIMHTGACKHLLNNLKEKRGPTKSQCSLLPSTSFSQVQVNDFPRPVNEYSSYKPKRVNRQFLHPRNHPTTICIFTTLSKELRNKRTLPFTIIHLIIASKMQNKNKEAQNVYYHWQVDKILNTKSTTEQRCKFTQEFDYTITTQGWSSAPGPNV